MNRTYVIRLAFLAWLFALMSYPAHSTEPYYGFYPSSHGERWKALRHHILGFSIDIPASWTFGIAGQPPASVALVYPEGLNTSVFSEAFGMIEVGILPFRGLTPSEASLLVIAGMKARHPTLEMQEQPTQKPLGVSSSIRFQYSWPSNSGFRIREIVNLVSDGEKVYSVTIRSVPQAHDKNGELYTKIVNSFKPI